MSFLALSIQNFGGAFYLILKKNLRLLRKQTEILELLINSA